MPLLAEDIYECYSDELKMRCIWNPITNLNNQHYLLVKANIYMNNYRAISNIPLKSELIGDVARLMEEHLEHCELDDSLLTVEVIQ